MEDKTPEAVGWTILDGQTELQLNWGVSEAAVGAAGESEPAYVLCGSDVTFRLTEKSDTALRLYRRAWTDKVLTLVPSIADAEGGR